MIHLFLTPCSSFLTAINVNTCPGRKFLRPWTFWFGILCQGSQDTELEARLLKSKTILPSITETIYRMARALALTLQQKCTESKKRQCCVRQVSRISGGQQMLRGKGERVQRSGSNECTASVSGSLWFRASFDSEVALASLCLTANIRDYIQFALVFTSYL